MTGMELCQVKLVLDIGQGDIEIAHGHLGRGMTEKLHERPAGSRRLGASPWQRSAETGAGRCES